MEPSGVSPELASQLELLAVYRTGTEVGTVLSSMLFGVFCVQLYTYVTSSRKESIWMRVLVAVVAALETSHTIFLWIFLFESSRQSLLISPLYMTLDSPTLVLALFVTALNGSVVQSYYAYRIARFTRTIWFSILPWIGSLARAGIAIYATALAIHEYNTIPNYTIFEFNQKYGWVMQGTFASSVGVDVFSTVCLSIILWRHRSGMGTPIIDKLIVWTVETGLLTSAMAVAQIVIVVIKRYELLPGFTHVYPNMFSLTLMLSLNAREGLRRALYTKPTISTLSSRTQGTNARMVFSQTEPYPGDVVVAGSDTFKLEKLPRDNTYEARISVAFKDSEEAAAGMAV